MDLLNHAIRQAKDAEHARFSPSSAERWMTCPGSIAFTRDLPNPSSEYADEGTAAHTLASRALTYGKPAAFFHGEEIQAGERVFTVDDDMASFIQVYLDEVNARVGDGTLMVEQKIEFSHSIGVPGQFGTSDATILSADGKHLTVIDLKYGQGVRVDAQDNPQLKMYAAGVLETFGDIFYELETVETVVVQPRLDHIDHATYTIAEIAEFMRTAHLAAQAALEGCQAFDETGVVPPELFKPSDDACFFCPGKATCEALRRHVSALVFDDFETLDDPTVLEVTGAPAVPAGEKLGQLYGYLELVEDWCRGVRAEVERMVFAGMEVIGPDGQRMKLVEGKRGNRVWADEQLAEARLAGLVPPDRLYKPRKLISVSDVGKMFDKKATKAQWEALQDLITQSKGKAKVALGSDPAPPYTADAASDEFEDLGND
jgi:hypothetical protein